ncbi:hypothetical protein [uncultured Pontibacter sp.]|nr:hypothetical protein [uncultured Pontibacter sp.]
MARASSLVSTIVGPLAQFSYVVRPEATAILSTSEDARAIKLELNASAP